MIGVAGRGASCKEGTQRIHNKPQRKRELCYRYHKLGQRSRQGVQTDTAMDPPINLVCYTPARPRRIAPCHECGPILAGQCLPWP